jgi:NDP-sugar pyrophosphorylase family protein
VPLSISNGRIKVVIERLLEQLKKAGVRDVIVVVNYKKEALMDYLGDGKRHGMNVWYCFQEDLNGDAGGIYLSKNLLKETFMALDADNYYEDDLVFKKIVDEHKKHKPIATVARTRVEDTRNYAIMKLDGDNVVDLIEKPMENPKWNNDAKLGIFVFEPEIFDYDQNVALSETGSFSTTHLLKSLAKKGKKVRAVPISGYFTDIGTWDSYEKFVAWFSKHGGKK